MLLSAHPNSPSQIKTMQAEEDFCEHLEKDPIGQVCGEQYEKLAENSD